MDRHVSNPLSSDADFYRQQDTIFTVLNLILLLSLLLANLVLARFWGPITLSLFLILLGGFFAHSFLLICLRSNSIPSDSWALVRLTEISIAVNAILTVATSATNKYDSQYYILMSVPVLQAAFRYKLRSTLLVIGLGNALNFFWIWQFSRLSGPVDVDEYIEAGTISLLYTFTGIVVWVVVKRLRKKEAALVESYSQLEATRSKLLQEEKLSAIGRLSSAISHEIRNPVAMITSSLALAEKKELESAERAEMFSIATKEAARLEKLTNDFLVYARPRALKLTSGSVNELLRYVAGICRGYAAERNTKVELRECPELTGEFDEQQLQQALLNLAKNALEASLPGGTTGIWAENTKGAIEVHVENGGPAISAEELEHLFEPFYSMKTSGTGLGLAITRAICREHGGDVVLSQNREGSVRFTVSLPIRNRREAG